MRFFKTLLLALAMLWAMQALHAQSEHTAEYRLYGYKFPGCPAYYRTDIRSIQVNSSTNLQLLCKYYHEVYAPPPATSSYYWQAAIMDIDGDGVPLSNPLRLLPTDPAANYPPGVMDNVYPYDAVHDGNNSYVATYTASPANHSRLVLGNLPGATPPSWADGNATSPPLTSSPFYQHGYYSLILDQGDNTIVALGMDHTTTSLEVAKFDAAAGTPLGTIDYTSLAGTPAHRPGEIIQASGNSDYLFCGKASDNSFIIARLTQGLSQVWAKECTLPLPNPTAIISNTEARGIVYASGNNHYFVVGFYDYTSATTPPSSDMFLAEFDQSGNLQNTLIYTSTQLDRIQPAAIDVYTSGGGWGLVVAGRHYLPGPPPPAPLRSASFCDGYRQ